MPDTPPETYHPYFEDLRNLDAAIPTTGNSVEIFFEGDDVFDSMKKAVAEARDFVHLEIYEFADDRTGNSIATALMKKAREGIEVRIVVDGVGSLEVPESRWDEMKESGIEFFTFRPLAPWRKRRGILGRNHRKNLIIDDRVAFLGGMNLVDCWSRKISGDDVWRDTHLRLEGPAAAACNHFFQETWAKVGGSRIDRKPDPHSTNHKPCAETSCLVIGGRGFSNRHASRELYKLLLQNCKKNLRFTIPYFAPPHRFVRKIIAASKRGLDIEFLIPKNSDRPIADWIREGLYPSLIKYGLQFHEYRPGILHAKTVTGDDRFAIIGSANLDPLSLSLNWELSVLIEDPALVEALNGQWEKDVNNSDHIPPDWKSERPLLHRIVSRIGATLMRVI